MATPDVVSPALQAIAMTVVLFAVIDGADVTPVPVQPVAIALHAGVEPSVVKHFVSLLPALAVSVTVGVKVLSLVAAACNTGALS